MIFFLHAPRAHSDLHSFPTRRSSDLGSKDRTSEIAHAHPRVRVVDTPNQGLSAARNVALAAATGEIVAYTDADTRVEDRKSTRLNSSHSQISYAVFCLKKKKKGVHYA